MASSHTDETQIDCDSEVPTLGFVSFDRLKFVHQVVGAPLGDLLGKYLLIVREVL